MTEEKEVVQETNGDGTETEVNGKETTAEESNKMETGNAEVSEKENVEKPDVDIEAEIIRQVEYYFGDVNLPRDKFLREQVKLDDGWVPLQVLTRFNRLSKLTTDVDVLEKTLKKSTSGLLEVGDKKIRRHPDNPVPEYNEDRRKQLLSRTVYLKGFPKDADLDVLLTFFKEYKEVENLIMRRYLDKRIKKRMFKGSIFVTFKLREQAVQFMEKAKDLKYKDTALLVMWQEDYLRQKQAEHDMRKNKREKKPKVQPAKPDFKLPSGTTMTFEDGSGKISREDIKSALLKIDQKVEISFIDYKVGVTQGWIRLLKEDAAKEFHKLLEDGKLKVGEETITMRVLEGDEEKQYLEKTVQEMTKRRKGSKLFKYNKGKGNFAGKQGKKRRQREHEDAPPAKVKADS